MSVKCGSIRYAHKMLLAKDELLIKDCVSTVPLLSSVSCSNRWCVSCAHTDKLASGWDGIFDVSAFVHTCCRCSHKESPGDSGCRGSQSAATPLPLFAPLLAEVLAGPMCPSQVHIEDT